MSKSLWKSSPYYQDRAIEKLNKRIPGYPWAEELPEKVEELALSLERGALADDGLHAARGMFMYELLRGKRIRGEDA